MYLRDPNSELILVTASFDNYINFDAIENFQRKFVNLNSKLASHLRGSTDFESLEDDVDDPLRGENVAAGDGCGMGRRQDTTRRNDNLDGL